MKGYAWYSYLYSADPEALFLSGYYNLSIQLKKIDILTFEDVYNKLDLRRFRSIDHCVSFVFLYFRWCALTSCGLILQYLVYMSHFKQAI